MVMIFKDTECLLFDMDGVILDNTYDNNFWQNQIPSVLAKKRQISFEAVSYTHLRAHET